MSAASERIMDRMRRRFQHGRGMVYRSKCDCGWLGSWTDNSLDADAEYDEHLKDALR